ncbi:glycosyltransferase [Paenisporosarcina sp. NPDC076898]|uniref:glycosyltransferase n=1 Tax=unclassified Paenisporosarcina TaxID=2642018 RepID=UPI003D02A517
MSKKNLLFILPSLQGGGAEKVTLNIIKDLDKEKFNITLLLIKKEGVYWDLVPDHIKLISILNQNDSITKNLYRIIKQVIKFSKDNDIIIGALELTATYLAIIAGTLLNKPRVGWLHINLKEFPHAKKFSHKILIKLLYPLLNVVIAVSNGARNSLIEISPSLEKKIVTVYNPLPMDVISKLADEDIDINFNINSSIPMILGMGRLTYQKGFEYLITAHANLIKNGYEHNLIILGEGEERSHLESLVKKLGVSNTVFLPGFQSNPYSWMKKADLFVLSSRFEGFGMVLGEAMSLGVPVISTNCPSGPEELLNSGEYGILVPVEDSVNLSKAIENLFVKPKVMKDYSIKAKGRASEFSPLVIIPKIESIFNSLYKKK